MKMEWNYGKKGIADCFLVRKKVFIDEQQFSEELEFDEIDAKAYHLCIYNENKPIATARLFEENGVYHCGRICILSEYRGKGIGLALMQEIERKAKEFMAKTLVLSAQVRVKPFYLRAGYIEYGEEYLDEYCPHIEMRKDLRVL